MYIVGIGESRRDDARRRREERRKGQQQTGMGSRKLRYIKYRRGHLEEGVRKGVSEEDLEIGGDG